VASIVPTHSADASSVRVTSIRIPLSVVTTTAAELPLTSTGAKLEMLDNRLRHQNNRCGTIPCRAPNAGPLSPLASHAESTSRASSSFHRHPDAISSATRRSARRSILASRRDSPAANGNVRRNGPRRQGTVWRTDTHEGDRVQNLFVVPALSDQPATTRIHPITTPV
jgi:hypothetical protein